VNFAIDEIDHLPRRVSIVFIDPPTDVSEVVVDEIRLESYAFASRQNRVFVHPSLLDARCSSTPKSQENRGIITAVTNPAITKNHFSLQSSARDVLR